MQIASPARLQAFHQALASRTLVKAIAGINNYDKASIATLLNAVNHSTVSAVDVAACPDIVGWSRQQTQALIFASSVSPSHLLKAAQAGADVLELGNFDALYEEGIYLTADDVLRVSSETLALLDKEGLGATPLCVTIPGHLSVSNQIKLAQALEKLGVSLIQTEGSSRLLSDEPHMANLSVEDKAQISIRNTRVLAQATKLPLMTASGIHAGNVAACLEAGASAVGLGRSITGLGSQEERTAALNAAQQAMLNYVQPASLCSLAS